MKNTGNDQLLPYFLLLGIFISLKFQESGRSKVYRNAIAALFSSAPTAVFHFE